MFQDSDKTMKVKCSEMHETLYTFKEVFPIYKRAGIIYEVYVVYFLHIRVCYHVIKTTCIFD